MTPLYKSPKRLGQILYILLIATITLRVVTYALNIILIPWISNLPRQVTGTAVLASTNSNALLGFALIILGLTLILISLASYGVSVSTVVFQYLWIYRLRKNLIALNVPGLEFSPDWSVACFFVPIIGLYLPWQMMKETACTSQPMPAGTELLSWKKVHCTSLVHWWWGLSIGAWLIWYSIYGSPVIWNLVVEGTWTGFAPNAFTILSFAVIPGLFVLIFLVRHLTVLQEAKYTSLFGTSSQQLQSAS